MEKTYQERVDEIVATMTPEQRAVWEHSQSHLEHKLGQVLAWVGEFRALVELLETEALATPWHAVQLFWIRLHGVLTEFATDIANKYDLAKRSRFEPIVGAAVDALRALRDALDDEDVVAADWCRQRAAHVFQRGYSPQLQRSKGGEVVKDSYRVKVLDRHVPIEQLDKIIERVMTRDGEHTAAAVRIARRISPHVSALCGAVARMHLPA